MTQVKIIAGYISGVDRIPKGIVIPKPYRRIAVVTDTYDASGEADGSMVIESSLLANLIFELSEKREFEVSLKSGRRLRVVNSPSQQEIEEMIENNELHSALIFKEGRPFLQIFEVYWFMVGGPEPYHDSATLEVFVPDSSLREVTEKIHNVLAKKSISFLSINGEPAPSMLPWWKRIFETLFQ